MSNQDQYTNEHKVKLIAAILGNENNHEFMTLAGLMLRLAQDRPAVRWAVIRMLNNMLDALDGLDAASGPQVHSGDTLGTVDNDRIDRGPSK